MITYISKSAPQRLFEMEDAESNPAVRPDILSSHGSSPREVSGVYIYKNYPPPTYKLQAFLPFSILFNNKLLISPNDLLI